MIQLDVPIVRQKEGTVDCGPAGLSMILKYYNINKTIDELKQDIKIYENMGTYAPQLGLYLLKNRFDVEIVLLNPHLFTKQFQNKNQNELLDYFDELLQNPKKEKFKEPINYFKEYIQAGGKLTVKIPTIDDIEEELNNDRPVGALVTSNFLLYDKAVFNFHFNIITGIDEKYVYVNDPMWDYRGGKQKYEKNEFLYALYASAHGDADNASLIKIKKK